MNCDEVQNRIGAYVDDALPPEQAELVSAHLESCAGCRSEADAELELRRRTRRLAAGIDPPEAVWRGIARAIDRRKIVRPGFGGRWSVAAAVSATLVVALVTGYTVGRQQGRMESARGRFGAPGAAGRVSPSVLDVDAYEVARESLLSALESRRDSMSEETLRVVDANLKVIEAAIVRMTDALAHDPNNPLLTYRLAAAYRRQIELLQQATRLPAEI